MRALIRRLGKDHTVLLSTHILSEVEATCTRALVIARGELVAQGSIEEIRALRRSAGVRIVVRAGDEAGAKLALERASGVAGVAKATAGGEREGDALELVVELDAGADGARVTEDVVAALCAAGVRVREAAPRLASLEQVFSSLTEDATPSDGEAA